jgi:hypothetical protein
MPSSTPIHTPFQLSTPHIQFPLNSASIPINFDSTYVSPFHSPINFVNQPSSFIPIQPTPLSPMTPCTRYKLFLRNKLQAGWFDLSDDTRVIVRKHFYHINGIQALITFMVRQDCTWSVTVIEQELEISHHLLSVILKNINDVDKVYTRLASSYICIGNPDKKFHDLHGKKERRTSKLHLLKSAYIDNHRLPGIKDSEEIKVTVRHVQCLFLIKKSGRCEVCTKYRHQLRTFHRRNVNPVINTISRTNTSSSVNFRFLSTPEKQKRFQSARSDAKLKIAQLKRMLNSHGITVDNSVHSYLSTIMKNNNDKVLKEFPPGSFQRLFWEEQLKCAKLSNARNMKWHPMIIKWCLYMKNLSSGTYEALRSTGVLTLPSQRTLRDYTHFTPSKVGFSAEVDQLLLSEAKVHELEEFQKHVIILIDEMHIRDDLVYNKHTGELVGFVNLDTVNNHLMHLGKYDEKASLATYVFVLMVRGLFINLEFPYASFPTKGVTADAMFPIIWEAIMRLELCELKVVGVTADGASPNRKFFKLHQKSYEEHITYKTRNPFSVDGSDIFFISDPPHLLKTIRNCLFNNKRLLWNNGKYISSKHVCNVYNKDSGGYQGTTGLALVPKLSQQHLQLTPYSKMSVRLAAQVLSETVGKALELVGGEEAKETANFILRVDKFFDCLNVKSISEGCKKLKAFREPYRSGDDFRFRVPHLIIKYCYD